MSCRQGVSTKQGKEHEVNALEGILPGIFDVSLLCFYVFSDRNDHLASTPRTLNTLALLPVPSLLSPMKTISDPDAEQRAS